MPACHTHCTAYHHLMCGVPSLPMPAHTSCRPATFPFPSPVWDGIQAACNSILWRAAIFSPSAVPSPRALFLPWICTLQHATAAAPLRARATSIPPDLEGPRSFYAARHAPLYPLRCLHTRCLRAVTQHRARTVPLQQRRMSLSVQFTYCVFNFASRAPRTFDTRKPAHLLPQHKRAAPLPPRAPTTCGATYYTLTLFIRYARFLRARYTPSHARA